MHGLVKSWGSLIGDCRQLLHMHDIVESLKEGCQWGGTPSWFQWELSSVVTLPGSDVVDCSWLSVSDPESKTKDSSRANMQLKWKWPDHEERIYSFKETGHPDSPTICSWRSRWHLQHILDIAGQMLWSTVIQGLYTNRIGLHSCFPGYTSKGRTYGWAYKFYPIPPERAIGLNLVPTRGPFLQNAIRCGNYFDRMNPLNKEIRTEIISYGFVV